MKQREPKDRVSTTTVVGRLDSRSLASKMTAGEVGMHQRELEDRVSTVIASVGGAAVSTMTDRAGNAPTAEYQAQILGSVREIVVASDLAGRITYWGNGAAECLGYTAQEALGQPLTRFLPDLPTPSTLVGTEAARGPRFERKFRRMDGSALTLDGRVSPLWGHDGEAVGLVVAAIDITPERDARDQARRLTSAIEFLTDAVVITNAEAEIEYVNPAFESTTGFGRDEVMGRNARLLSSGVQAREFYEAMWATLRMGRPWRGDLVNRRKDGRLFTERSTISPIFDDGGTLQGYVAIKRDVTEDRRRESAAVRHEAQRISISRAIAAIDSSGTVEEQAAAISRQVVALPGAVTAGIFVFDSEGLSVPLGFSSGSRGGLEFVRVPRARTSFLRRKVADGPYISRWHHQPDNPYDEIFRKVGVKAIAYAPLRLGKRVVGFVQMAAAGDDAEIKLVDSMPVLMEFASIAGGLVGGRLEARIGSDAARGGVSKVIRTAAFVPVFQPIVDLASGRVVGYEGLTRFRDRLPPDHHFDEAHNVGMGRELELATMEAALDASTDLPASAWLDLNASPRLIMESDELPNLLERSDREIVLEITEHEAIADYELFRAAFLRLGPKVRLAVDDAGAGFASLRHILELRPALVKLDRALIVGLDSDQARRALVAGIQHFAGDAKIRLIAEGVETAAELATLLELDISLGQGYLLGRPASAQELVSVQQLTIGARSRVSLRSRTPGGMATGAAEPACWQLADRS